jgi:hypothetical protein
MVRWMDAPPKPTGSGAVRLASKRSDIKGRRIVVGGTASECVSWFVPGTGSLVAAIACKRGNDEQ